MWEKRRQVASGADGWLIREFMRGGAGGTLDQVRAPGADYLRHARGRDPQGPRRRHVRGPAADRRDRGAFGRQGADALRALEDDLPVEQLPCARGAPERPRAARAPLLPEITERVPGARRDDPPAEGLQW